MKLHMLLVLISIYSLCPAKDVVSIGEKGQPFPERWNLALTKMLGAATVVYAIETTHSHHRSGSEKFMLSDLLGMRDKEAENYSFFVFTYNAQKKLVDVTIADSHSRIEHQKTIYWLGNADPRPSLEHVIHLFNTTRDRDLQKALLTAVGVHPGTDQSLTFLSDIIKKYPDSFVKEAVFWVGVQGLPKGVDVLLNTLKENENGSIKERVVFALHLMNDDRATQELIHLAKNAAEKSIRKKALFWLGVKAGKTVGQLLEETAFNDPETDLQKHAVFALSQLEPDEALPRLQRIAQEHPNISVRKKAIFWIGQSDDDRAVDIIVGFLK